MTNRAEFSNGVKEWFIRRRSHRREIDVGPAGNGEGSYQKRFRSVWIAFARERMSSNLSLKRPITARGVRFDWSMNLPGRHQAFLVRSVSIDAKSQRKVGATVA